MHPLKKNIFQKIKLLTNSNSTSFLKNTIRERKIYLLFNISSGILDAIAESFLISILYAIINLVTKGDKFFINAEDIFFIKNYDYLVNFLNSLSFKNIFILLILSALLVQLFQSIIKYINLLSTRFIEAFCLSRITKKIHHHIFSLSYKYSSKYKIGDLSDYINSSPGAIRTQLDCLNSLFVNLFVSIAYIAFLLKLSFLNFIVLILLVMLSYQIQKLLFPEIKKLSNQVLKVKVEISKNVIESFQGLRFIHTNGLIDFVSAIVNQQTVEYEKALRNRAKKMELLPPIISATPIVLIAIISILFSTFFYNSNLFAYIGTVLIIVQRLNTKVRSISDSLSRLVDNIPLLNRITSLIVEEGKDFRRLGGTMIKPPFKNVTFSNVNFKYSKNSNFALKNINFSMNSGEKTAIVGLSGAGKSSILDLLIGLFEPSSGEILVDGENFEKINITNWQKNISIVSQDTFLLNKSIIDNLKFGLKGITLADIKKACKNAGADEFIEKLPLKYKTIIGDRGFKLSGGQRQRIAISRALLRKSSILILDEATSSLDSKNEKIIQQNLEKLSENKIILIVAHRLSTIKSVDNILVLNDGMIVESGDHKSLLKKGGIYSKLWNIQTKN